MQMESDDPQTKGQQISTVMNLDQWIAPSVPGYDEIKQFYMKMAKELDWVPGQVSQGMANSGMQVNLAELRKSNMAHVQGMPLVQYTSMTLAGSGSAAADAQSAATAASATSAATSGQFDSNINQRCGGEGIGRPVQQKEEAAARAAAAANGG